MKTKTLLIVACLFCTFSCKESGTLNAPTPTTSSPNSTTNSGGSTSLKTVPKGTTGTIGTGAGNIGTGTGNIGTGTGTIGTGTVTNGTTGTVGTTGTTAGMWCDKYKPTVRFYYCKDSSSDTAGGGKADGWGWELISQTGQTGSCIVKGGLAESNGAPCTN